MHAGRRDNHARHSLSQSNHHHVVHELRALPHIRSHRSAVRPTDTTREPRSSFERRAYMHPRSDVCSVRSRQRVGCTHTSRASSNSVLSQLVYGSASREIMRAPNSLSSGITDSLRTMPEAGHNSAAPAATNCSRVAPGAGQRRPAAAAAAAGAAAASASPATAAAIAAADA